MSDPSWSHNNIIRRLQARLDKFSPKLALLTRYVIADPFSIQLESITDLAGKSCTSEATVFRLCKELGFSGYAQFKMALAIELSHPSIEHKDKKKNTKNSSIIEDNAQKAIQALENTVHIFDQASLNLAVTMLHRARVIYITGVAASSVVGHYLSYRLLRIGKSAIMYQDTHLAAMQACNKQIGDCWFIVSSAGSSTEVVHAATVAYNNKIPVISLSNVRHSPLSKVSNLVLVAAQPEGPLSGGAFASKVGALLLIDTLISHLLEIDPKYKQMIQTTAQSTSGLLI